MKKFLAFLFVIAIMAGGLSGCGSEDGGTDTTGEGTTSESGEETGGDARTTLVYGMSQDPSSLDPMNTASMNTFTVTYALYDTLMEEGPDGAYVPLLADEVTVSEDGLTYTITFNKEVKFHNGDLLTIDDIVFSLNRTIDAGWAADMCAAIDSVEKVDDSTAVIHMKRPFGGMLGSLASPFFSIMSQAYVEATDADDIKRIPMGTGPYKFVEWVSGDRIVLEAFEDHFAGAPAIKDVTFKPYVDKNTGLIALETGEIDVYLNINPVDIETVKNNDKLAFYSSDAAGVLSLNMNIEAAPLDDVRVRQAISYAVNKEDIVVGAIEGQGVPADTPIPTVLAGYSPDVKGNPYDPEKARELLAEAGYADGLKLVLRVKEDNKNQKVCEIIQFNLKEIGIDVEIDVMEGGAYTTEIYDNGNFELTVSSWYAMFLDAYSLMYSQFHKDCYGPTGNITHVVAEDLTALLDAAAEADDEHKVEAYKLATENIIENAYQLPLVYEQSTISTTSELKGVEAHPLGVYKIKNFYF